jgi:esterase/lipase
VTPPRLGMMASALKASAHIDKNLDKVDSPFLIIMGANDGCVHIPDSERLVEQSKSTDKAIVMIEHAKHQLFQDKPDVLADVINHLKDWIVKR